jgi:hypothetical protein
MVSPPFGAGHTCTGNAGAAQLPDARRCPDNLTTGAQRARELRWHTSSHARAARRQRLPRAPDAKVVGHRLERIRIGHPFLLRSVTPPIRPSKAARRRRRAPRQAHRLRLRRRALRRRPPDDRRPPALARAGQDAGANALAFFEFDAGTLALTEAGKQRRASLHRRRRPRRRSPRSTPAAST